MTEEVSSGWTGPVGNAQAEARRERRRKGEAGKAPWQPIVLPDDDEDEPSVASTRPGPIRPIPTQGLLAPSSVGMSARLRFDPEMLAPAAFRRIAARLQQQQSLWTARQAQGSGSAPAGAGPSGRAPAASIDLTDDCVVLDEASGSTAARGVKRRRVETPTPPLPPALRPDFVEPPPKPDREVKFTCSICLENMKEEATTICGHIFCKQCIVDSIKATKKCPTCRKKLGVKDVHRIYLQSSAT